MMEFGIRDRKSAFPVDNPTASHWIEKFGKKQKVKDYLGGKKDVKYDVVIVGGGMTGLSAAYHLAENAQGKLSILLIEARHIGHGATGRNGAHFWPSTDEFSHETSEDATTLTEENTRLFYSLMKKLGGDYKYYLTGGLDVTRFSSLANQWKDEYKDIYWDSEKIKEAIPYLNSEYCQAALYSKEAAQFMPIKFMDDLREYVLNHYPEVHFQIETKATKVIADPNSEYGYTIHTTKGSVQTKYLLHCTNAYTALLPKYIHKQAVPHRAQVILTNPLDVTIKHSLSFNDGWEYLIQRRDDRTVVFGGQRWTSETLEEFTYDDSIVNKSISHNLLENIRELFPKVYFHIQKEWTGIICNTVDEAPILGPLRQKEYCSIGYQGNGMTLALAGGKRLADAVLLQNPRKERWLKTFHPHRFLNMNKL